MDPSQSGSTAAETRPSGHLISRDVVHEIEPIQTGYRWVLAYNLINHSPGPPRSASALDAQISQFTEALTRWQNLQDEPHYLAYPLDHQYTDRDLKLARLKGGDFYQARHAAQSCEAHCKYYMLLGNMEMCLTNQNTEDEMEDEAVLQLDRIVDPQGFDLLIHSTRTISTTNLLHGQSYEDRVPDTQRGGNYLGNQYAEIDQFFKDSTLIIVPCHWILNFLLGSSFTLDSLARLTTKLRGFIGQAGDSSFRGLLLQVCQSILGRDYAKDEHRDLFLGPVAVSAAFLKKSDLFHTIASNIKGSFDLNHYSALGGLICFDDPSVQEDDLNTAITKCGKIYRIHENINAFRDGFFEGHPTGRTNCNVLYQGVRIFIEHFHDNNLLINPLLVELLSQSNHQGPSKIYLETLLRKIVESAVSNFNLCQYATYTATRTPPNQSEASSRSRGQEGSAISRKLAGPVKAFYEYTSTCQQDLPAQLLQRIQATASELTAEQSNGFLISFLSELIPVADTSFNEAQTCIRALITLYIIRTVGHEPKKPTDWTRLEEMYTGSHDNDISRTNTFLKDPETSYYALGNESIYDLKFSFHDFKYFDFEQKGYWGPIAGVTKTNKWWEEQYSNWQSRGEGALGAIKTLPQDRLKECLGDEYDMVMDLRMVKIVDDAVVDDAIQGDNEEKADGSSVPQKRRRGNSE
ncbi:MAG: hypothetical protein Q9223_000934 [Gallowayella weberi]